jgi:hypothetical protein
MNAIPTGPIEREPRPTPGEPLPSASEQEAALREVLATAGGVELGAYDERIIEWLGKWEWSTVATIASWVQRSGQGGQQAQVQAEPEQAKPKQAERERLAEVLGDALEAYFEEVDLEEADTEDMAWTLVRTLERASK